MTLSNGEANFGPGNKRLLIILRISLLYHVISHLNHAYGTTHRTAENSFFLHVGSELDEKGFLASKTVFLSSWRFRADRKKCVFSLGPATRKYLSQNGDLSQILRQSNCSDW